MYLYGARAPVTVYLFFFLLVYHDLILVNPSKYRIFFSFFVRDRHRQI